MKRLLCIVSSMDTGGAETFLMKMYRRMDRTRYQMDFAAACTKESYYDREIQSLGGTVYNVPLHTKHPVKNYTELRRIVREGRYQSVLKLLDSPIGAIDLCAAKAGGASRLCARSCNSLTGESALKKAINVPLRQLLNRISTVKFAPSDLAARYTFGDKAYENGKVILLHNALDLDVFRYSEENRRKIREEFGLGDAFVVGHVGRFTQQKNHAFLIKVFRKLKEVKPNAKLLLVGTGQLEDEVRQRCADAGVAEDVIFAGVRDDVPAILSALDVFCLPSFHEGMPNVCIESQATGLHCVIADTITRQADITGNVTYLSLEDADAWVRCLTETHSIERASICDTLKGSDYDINREVGNFTAAVFDASTVD